MAGIIDIMNIASLGGRGIGKSRLMEEMLKQFDDADRELAKETVFSLEKNMDMANLGDKSTNEAPYKLYVRKDMRWSKDGTLFALSKSGPVGDEYRLSTIQKGCKFYDSQTGQVGVVTNVSYSTWPSKVYVHVKVSDDETFLRTARRPNRFEELEDSIITNEDAEDVWEGI